MSTSRSLAYFLPYLTMSAFILNMLCACTKGAQQTYSLSCQGYIDYRVNQNDTNWIKFQTEANSVHDLTTKYSKLLSDYDVIASKCVCVNLDSNQITVNKASDKQEDITSIRYDIRDLEKPVICDVMLYHGKIARETGGANFYSIEQAIDFFENNTEFSYTFIVVCIDQSTKYSLIGRRKNGIITWESPMKQFEDEVSASN
jgi:hypothetical protein